jgi:hypothetical protein
LYPRPISLIHLGIQDFMDGYDYITVRAPLWLSHCGEKGVVRKGCLVLSHSGEGFLEFQILGFGPFCHSTPPYKALNGLGPFWLTIIILVSSPTIL